MWYVTSSSPASLLEGELERVSNGGGGVRSAAVKRYDSLSSERVMGATHAYMHTYITLRLNLVQDLKDFCPRSWEDHLYSSTQLTTRRSQNLGEQPFRQALSLYRPAASWKRAFKATEGIKRCLSVPLLPSLRRCVSQLWHFHSKLCRLIQSRVVSSTRKITTSSNLFLAHIV